MHWVATSLHWLLLKKSCPVPCASAVPSPHPPMAASHHDGCKETLEECVEQELQHSELCITRELLQLSSESPAVVALGFVTVFFFPGRHLNKSSLSAASLIFRYCGSQRSAKPTSGHSRLTGIGADFLMSPKKPLSEQSLWVDPRGVSTHSPVELTMESKKAKGMQPTFSVHGARESLCVSALELQALFPNLKPSCPSNSMPRCQ
jgi:hypothetical protein